MSETRNDIVTCDFLLIVMAHIAMSTPKYTNQKFSILIIIISHFVNPFAMRKTIICVYMCGSSKTFPV